MKLLAVNYHYLDMQESPYPGIHSLDSETFLKHIKFLKKNFDLIGIQDLSELGNQQNNYCLITFDDGLRCHFQSVIPLMKSYDFPAVFFVNSQPLSERKVLSVHKSQIVRSSIPPKKFHEKLYEYIDSRNINLANITETKVRKHYRYDDLDTAVRKYVLNYLLNEKDRTEFIDNLFNEIVPNEEDFVSEWYLNAEQIKYMQSNFNCIGSHSHSHSPLAQLTDENCANELARSKHLLEETTNTEINVLSYPLGNPMAVSKREAEIADQLGYDFCFTMERAVNRTLQDSKLLARVDCNDLPEVGKQPLFKINKGEFISIDGGNFYRKEYFNENF